MEIEAYQNERRQHMIESGEITAEMLANLLKERIDRTLSLCQMSGVKVFNDHGIDLIRDGVGDFEKALRRLER